MEPIGRLWWAPTSPFARKVRIAAHELGLAGRIELVLVDPWTDARLRILNPIAKVPTLELPDGQTFYESSVICDFLDDIAGRSGFVPASGPARWRALLLQGLADGAMTAAGRLFADEQRPADQRSKAVIRRQSEAVQAALAALEAKPPSSETFTIGEAGAAALLGYLDFRWPAGGRWGDWRGGRPRLALWFERVQQRASMVATVHSLSTR